MGRWAPTNGSSMSKRFSSFESVVMVIVDETGTRIDARQEV